MGAWMALCVGAHGWVAGIASHGSVLLSRGWLVTVEAPGHPGHPPYTQLDAVVKCRLFLLYYCNEDYDNKSLLKGLPTTEWR